MKKYFNKFFNKVPILKYILNTFIKCFIITILAGGLIYLILSLTGIYSKLESALDLKYNSPFVFIPIFAFAALAIICFVIGFLLYFHKYKRSKSKSKFNKAVSNILDNNIDRQVKSRRY